MTAESAGVMIPRPGAGSWAITDVRTVRLWVDSAGALQLRDRAGLVRELAPAETVHGCWWVQGPAMTAVGLPVATGGWLVLSGSAGPVLALRISDWVPAWRDLGGSDTLELSGAAGLARALGSDSAVLTDPAEAMRRLGTVGPVAMFTLEQPREQRYAREVLGTLFALLVAYPLLLLVCPAVVATAVAVAGLLLMPLFDLVPLMGRYRRTAGLPDATAHWWAAQPGRPGAGIGVVDGVAGRELVVADGYGWEGWYPGPAPRRATSMVLARDDAGTVWGLLLHDRDERLLELLDARDWVGEPGAVESLSAAAVDLGLEVTLTTMPRRPTLPGQRLSRSSGHRDVYTGLGAMICAGGMAVAFGCIALVEFLIGDGICFFVTGAALLVLRVLCRFRRVV